MHSRGSAIPVGQPAIYWPTGMLCAQDARGPDGYDDEQIKRDADREKRHERG